jgi:hypothetical protein
MNPLLAANHAARRRVNELRLAAGEIHNEWANESLPPKMRADQCNVMAEPLPQHTLGIRRLRSHSLRKLSLAIDHRVRSKHIRHRLWTPTPDPSPQGEGRRSVVEFAKHSNATARSAT